AARSSRAIQRVRRKQKKRAARGVARAATQHGRIGVASWHSINKNVEELEGALMNYRRVKCFNRKTGAFVGYLGWNSEAYVTVTSTDTDGDTSSCKWEHRGGDLYLARATRPNDRWIAESTYEYAEWNLTNYKPVVVNSDGTLSLERDLNRRLYGPYRKFR